MKTSTHFIALVVCTILSIAHAAAQDAFPIELAQGILAGEVADTSVLLQSRLTSTHPLVDRHWSGILGVKGVARFEVSEDADFAPSRFTGWIEAVPVYDFIVKTKVAGLEPGTRYYYRLHYGPNRERTQISATANFKTHAGPEADDTVSFAVVTGMNYSAFHHFGQGSRWPPYQGTDKHLGYPALAAMLKIKPDYFVATGDNVYYDAPRSVAPRPRIKSGSSTRSSSHSRAISTSSAKSPPTGSKTITTIVSTMPTP